MSRKPENTFIASVHKHLPLKLYSMKNHNEYNAGVADVWYSGPKKDLWIEYKFIVIPVRNGTFIDLAGGKSPSISALQQAWLTARAGEGRNVGVIVGSKEGGMWFPELSWDRTYTADYFRDHLVSRKELAKIIADFVS